ncbi:trehalase-like domain-containing protein, partial [Modestobacter lacusdianchii]
MRSYAAIGDGRTIALIARDGRIDWLPLPEMNAHAVFGALLDAESGGCIELCPVEEFTAEREYVEHTNVLTTTFTTASGRVRITDSLNSGIAGRLPWSELARRVEGLDGEVRLRAAVRPGTCLNTVSPWVHQTAHGPVLRVDDLTLAVRTSGADDVRAGDRRIDVDYTTGPGSRHLLALVSTEREPLFLPPVEAIDAGVDRTIGNWAAWMRAFEWDGPWDDAVRRSTLLLKLLIHAESGSRGGGGGPSQPPAPPAGEIMVLTQSHDVETTY